MTIEWLDAEFERARVTRGWFVKRYAIVKRISHQMWNYEVTNTRFNGHWYDGSWMEDRREEALAQSPWIRVRPLPEARVITSPHPRATELPIRLLK